MIPVLRKRGLIFDDYAVPGGSFRENLLRQPGQHHLRADHYGSKFNYKGDEFVPWEAEGLLTSKTNDDDVEVAITKSSSSPKSKGKKKQTPLKRGRERSSKPKLGRGKRIRVN